MNLDPTVAAPTAEWGDRITQVERLTRQHGDQLAAIWPDLTHHLNSIQSLLVQTQELAARLRVVEGAVIAPGPSATSAVEASPHGWSDADRRRLEDQGLFVVGTARSGTTILYETLNEAADVYLLGEAMLYEEAHRTNFAEFHQQRHEGYHNPKHKGHYLPRRFAAVENGFDLLRRLGERYRHVGEKVALGPWHVTEHGLTAFESFLRFHATHFFHSRYALIVRRPGESVASMARLWERFTIPELLTTWAVGFRVGVELAFTFPHVFMLAHDKLSEESAVRLGRALGVEFTVPAGRFDREFQQTAGAADRLPPRLVPYRPQLDALTALFDEWVAAFCPDTFRYAHREASRGFAGRLVERAGELVEELTSLTEPELRAG